MIDFSKFFLFAICAIELVMAYIISDIFMKQNDYRFNKFSRTDRIICIILYIAAASMAAITVIYGGYICYQTLATMISHQPVVFN